MSAASKAAVKAAAVPAALGVLIAGTVRWRHLREKPSIASRIMVLVAVEGRAR